jgi:hypothetical protein
MMFLSLGFLSLAEVRSLALEGWVFGKRLMQGLMRRELRGREG